MLSSKLHLYNLVDQYKILLDLETPEEYQTAIEQLQGDIAEKAENVALVIKTFEANMVAINSEIERLQTKCDNYHFSAVWFRNYLQRELESAKMFKVESSLVTVLLRKAPMSVEVVCEQDIPPEFMRVIPERREPDKRFMLESKKSHESMEIPGIKFITDKRTLQIK